MAADIKLTAGIDLSINAGAVKNQLKDLQKQLQQISNMKVDIGTGNLTADIEKASEAAMKLSAHLATATNPQTGNLDFTKFYTSIQKSGAKLEDYGAALQNMGPAGQKAFVSLADSISKSEIPLKRTSKLVDGMWDNLKKTIGWQLSSSLVHGFIGHIQKAVGYAQDLNKSLTDIRIVTGQSGDQMAKFAREANIAAKNLNTTTTQYTKASLIYYQQGLSDSEVKERAETTIKMANVTGTSAQKVSDQMTAIWNNYDNGTKSLTHYADVMTALGAATASSTDEIAEGLQKFASISNTVGLSYEYAASALATITATSRESADVTGNALKTLFSRIQGLQLGETLDDGTTLNKYSTALAKVGISIKEQSGELKSMDTILDEMGTKWDSLANDEKMALAQTVAGVRQYTQLITLMDNWDSFKQNLNIANTSQGTLDSQAAIYAESWEAASNRVRASWEGLWDTMIDSDSMVNLLDLFSGFIDILDTMAQSAGGVTGVLTSFLGIATKIFSPQLTKSVSNMVYGIGMLFGGQSRMESARLGILKDAYNSLSQDSAFGALYGAEESKARQQAMKDQLAASINYAENKTHMTPFQQLMEQHYASQQQAHNEARIQAAARYDSAKEQASDAYWDMYDKNNRGKLFNHLDREIYDDLTAEEKAERGYLYQQQQYGDLSDREANRLKELNFRNTVDGQILKQQKALAKFSNTMNSLGTMDADKRVTAFNEAIQTFTNETGQNIDETIMARLQEQVSSGQLTEATNGVNRLGQTIRDNLATQIANDLGVAEDNTEMRDKIRNRINSVYNRESSYLGIPGELSQREREENQKQSKIQAGAQAAVSGAQGLLSTVSAIQALEGLQQQIAAVGDGAGNVVGILSSLASVLMSSAMGFNGLNGALTAMKVPAGAAAGWAAGIMLALVAITALAKEIDKNNISEKERIKTLQQSDAELNNATESSKKLIDTYKTQNDNYNESIEKIKTNMTNPDQLANDVFYANKQAMELVSEYGLKENQYSKNSMGLIEIDQKILDSQVEAMEKANIDLQRASALSGATTQQELAEIEIEDLLSSGKKRSRTGGGGRGKKRARRTDYYFANEDGTKWTFEDALKNYGTEEWDRAKQASGKDKLFDDLEKQILEYQEANNLLNLAARNNVDYLLKSQEYTLDGAETFAALAYEDYKKKYDEEYENGIFSKDNLSNLEENHKNQIKKYLEAQGYTEVENIDFDGSNTSKFTFDHSGGEGSVNVEAVRKWDAEQAAASGAQETFDKSFDVLQHLTNKNAETAPGLMSLLTGDNFVNTTIGEMEAAKKATIDISSQVFKRIDELKEQNKHTGTDDDIADIIKDNFGISVEEFKDLFNIGDTVNLGQWFAAFANYTSKAQRLISGEPLLDQWLNGKGNNDTFGERIRDNLNQGTLTSLYDSFKKASLLGGEDAGQNMINGITEVLKNSNLDESDWDQAVQGLLAIDWNNTLTSAGAAASVIENLGGTLDTTTAAWQAFAAAMAAAAGGIPDFSQLINQLTQLAGALQGVAQGDMVSADIVDQLVAMNPELADLFSKHWSGDYTFLGENNDILQDTVWDNLNKTHEEAAKTQDRYNRYMENGGNKYKDNDDITNDDFYKKDANGNIILDENGNPIISGTGHATVLANIAGYDGQAQADILNNYNQAEGNLNAWDTGREITMPDGTTRKVIRNPDGTYTDENGNAIDNSVAMTAETQWQADQTAYTTASGAMNTMLNDIHGLDEVSGDWSQEDIESAISTADSLSEVYGRIADKQSGLVDANGDLAEGTMKGLEALALQGDYSERTQQAIAEQIAAEQALQELRKDPNADEGAIRDAEAIRDEAAANAELQAAIDEVAAARGLDAEAVNDMAQYIQELHSDDDEWKEWAKQNADAIAEMSAEMAEAAAASEDIKKGFAEWKKALNSKDIGASSKAFRELTNNLFKLIKAEDTLSGKTKKLGQYMENYLKKNMDKVKKAAEGNEEAYEDLQDAMAIDSVLRNTNSSTEQATEAVSSLRSAMKALGDDALQVGDVVAEGFNVGANGVATGIASMNSGFESLQGGFNDLLSLCQGNIPAFQDAIGQMGYRINWIPVDATSTNAPPDGTVWTLEKEDGYVVSATPHTVSAAAQDATSQYYTPQIVFEGGNTAGGGGSGGGGGGGEKEPKKVAQTRRSQVVKRYKNIDAKRSANKNRRDNMSKKTDKLYGEAKITNLEKENKLLEEGLKLNQKKSEEAMKNLKIDQEAVIAMGQKYGYEVKFDSEGNLENYEEILGDLYDQLHALEADNLMDEAEEKVKEEIEIKKTEIEGAIEDLEDTLKQLEELNNEYEEMIDEMHENNLEKITYRLEFELELNELDTEWNDFLLEQIGDDFTQTAAAMDLVTKKIATASENIEHYKQSVTDLIELIDNDPDRSLITGYLEDGVLTDGEAEILKEAYSGIIEQIEAIAEAKEEAEDRLISIFEGYNERIDLDMTSLEHYASLLEHFGNVVDIVGQKQLGLSDKFMETMSNMRIDQSRDIMSAAQTNLSAMQKIKAEAEAELEKAREEGRTNDIDYWQERLDEANTAIEESRDELVAAFENSLTAIADAFDAAIERVIDTFNNTIYAFGGLEGLSADYAIMKETSDLIAADYEKIYELSKITRNINKTLNDSNIIAGKQKMLDLQKEINELQANGTEMSKYDLEYLQAKYELRLAEIELENAQNNKDTVRLSKDSEGNWSYIYTSSTDAVEEAQQKYEDALYNMQNLSYEYIDEMSEKIVSASQSMMEEIDAIDKTKFKDEVELMEEVNRIKQKYAEQLGLSEEELNKALANNNDLYNQDWQLYNQKTGYAVSSAQDWIDSYRETALGQLTGSESDVSDYMDNFLAALDELTESIKRVASDYYFNVNETMKAAGITKDDFGNFVLSNTTAINKASENTKKNIETQTQNLVKDFNTQADKVTENQRILNDYVEENRDYLEWIKNWLNESSQKTKEQQGKDATYTYKEAAELFNSKYANVANGYEIELTGDGKWSKTVEGVKNEILAKHQAAKESGDKELQAHYADMYTWLTSYILPYTTSLDTGGYTGAWGTSGKLAMLHEKELVLNAEDTANFLDALHISRDIINSMIEMNARQSSYALGGMTPGVLQDMSQKLEQQVSIMAEFPNATDHNEIEEAFNNLINTASQYANKYNI